MTDETMIVLATAWVFAWIAISVLYRKASNKPLFPRVPEDADFREEKCSGHSLGNPLARLAGASDCLLVYVSEGRLTVVPMFPFNLMFLPEVYGLEITAPVAAVKVDDGSDASWLSLSIEGESRKRLAIRLRDHQAFRHALANITME